MTITMEWVAIAALGLLSAGLLMALMGMSRRLQRIADSQRALVQQQEAVHRAQMAYSEATEEAMSYLRDGLQSLTTVNANLDMKVYALELQQARAEKRLSQQDRWRQKSGDPVPAVTASSAKTVTQAGSLAAMPAAKSYSTAEKELLAAVGGKTSRVA